VRTPGLDAPSAAAQLPPLPELKLANLTGLCSGCRCRVHLCLRRWDRGQREGPREGFCGGGSFAGGASKESGAGLTARDLGGTGRVGTRQGEAGSRGAAGGAPDAAAGAGARQGAGGPPGAGAVAGRLGGEDEVWASVEEPVQGRRHQGGRAQRGGPHWSRPRLGSRRSRRAGSAGPQLVETAA